MCYFYGLHGDSGMIVLIVLNYNDADTVIQYINKIKEYKNIDHIVIVDNCSTDDSYDRLKVLESGDKILLIQTDRNKGYASGNNFGAYYAKEKWNPDYLVISNPDVEFEEDVIDELKGVFSIKDDAAGVTCMMNCTSGIKLPVAWRIPTYRDCLMENLIILKRLLHYSNEYSSAKLGKVIVAAEAIPGSFFMVDTKRFLEVEGFDENTFLYYEENILGKRFKEKGYKQYLLTKYEYIHRHSVSINRTYEKVGQRLRMGYKGREYYCVTYLGINKLQKLLLRTTFEIGTFNYVVAKRILRGH